MRVQNNEAKGVLNYESSDEEKDIIKATPSSRKVVKNINHQVSVAQIAPSEWLEPKPKIRAHQGES